MRSVFWLRRCPPSATTVRRTFPPVFLRSSSLSGHWTFWVITIPSMSSPISGLTGPEILSVCPLHCPSGDQPSDIVVHRVNPPPSSESGLLSPYAGLLPRIWIRGLGRHLNGPGKEQFSNGLSVSFCHGLFPSLSRVSKFRERSWIPWRKETHVRKATFSGHPRRHSPKQNSQDPNWWKF